MTKTAQEVGFSTSVKNFLIRVDGLPTIKVNDVIENEAGARGWVSSIYRDEVEVLMLDENSIHPGDLFKRTSQQLNLNVGEFLLGRAVNPLGVAVDGKGQLTKAQKFKAMSLDQSAHGISKRKFITDQFHTGITLIDTLIPIGKGQRELIMGDARSGKTNFITDLIVNQKNTGVICVYALIGKPITEVRNIIDTLKTNKALAHTIIIAASSTDIAPLIFLAPHTAMTVAEYFQQQGKDVLVIFDDLGNHAKIYREISLLGNKSPGRESYPGDIFYQHAHLLERAGSFSGEVGGGSITALPVIELNMSDFTTLIPTNLMAMTDGHLLFKSSLSSQGQRPAIDIFLSVSRVGRQTQLRLQNNLSFRIRQVLTQAQQLETLSRFSTELPMEIQQLLKQSQHINDLISQNTLTYIPREVQTILLSLVLTPLFQTQNQSFAVRNKQVLLENLIDNKQFHQMIELVHQTEDLEEFLGLLRPYLTKLGELCQP